MGQRPSGPFSGTKGPVNTSADSHQPVTSAPDPGSGGPSAIAAGMASGDAEAMTPLPPDASTDQSRRNDAEQRAIDNLVRSLGTRFPRLPIDAVRRTVVRNYAAFDGCTVRNYLTILTEKSALAELNDTERTLQPAP